MHLRAMSFFTAQDHVPLVPSPLNPFAPPRRRRHSQYRGRIPMSPSEKLLRRKAAEAWRSEIMYRQVAEYERRAIEAMEIEEEENAKVVGFKELDDEQYSLEGVVDRTEALRLDSRGRHAPARYKLLPVPHIGFFSPRRLIRCMGFWRIFTPRRMKGIFKRERMEVK